MIQAIFQLNMRSVWNQLYLLSLLFCLVTIAQNVQIFEYSYTLKIFDYILSVFSIVKQYVPTTYV